MKLCDSCAKNKGQVYLRVGEYGMVEYRKRLCVDCLKTKFLNVIELAKAGGEKKPIW